MRLLTLLGFFWKEPTAMDGEIRVPGSERFGIEGASYPCSDVAMVRMSRIPERIEEAVIPIETTDILRGARHRAGFNVRIGVPWFRWQDSFEQDVVQPAVPKVVFIRHAALG